MDLLVPTVLAMAVGAALSPTLFVTSELLLASPSRPRAKALAFAAGAAMALGVMAVLVFTAVAPAIVRAATSVDGITATIDVALGVVLLALAVYFGLRRAPGFRPHQERAGAPAADDARAWRWLLIGLAITGRDMTTMILYYDALEHVAVAGLPLAGEATLSVIVFVITSISVWLPLVVRIEIPVSWLHRVDRLKEWVLHHRRPLRVGTCLVFGAFLVAKGALELARL